MTDDRDGDDIADWLSAQFGEPKDEKADAAEPPSEPTAEPASEPAPAPIAPELTAPEPSTPAPKAFTWGLTPSTATDEPPVSPATAVIPATAVPPLPEPEPEPIAEPQPEPHAEPQPEPEPFDSSLAGPPSPEAEPRTMVMPWESASTQLLTPAPAADPIAEPATELLSGFGTVPADAAAGSSVDALFGETQFRDYESMPATAQNSAEPVVAAATATGAQRQPQRQPLPHSQKLLFWIAGSLIALLVLIVLFLVGTKLPHSAAAPVPVPTPTATKSATPTPTPAVPVVGPLAPGTYKWNLLLGGECLIPFTSPWEEKFTVVGCATPHLAQMVARGTFVEPTAAATDPAAPATPSAGASQKGSTYPGVAGLQAQINLLCSAPTVINFAAAGAYKDIQFSASYPANDKQWADGDHNYYCFVTRSSGDPLTASVAVAPAA